MSLLVERLFIIIGEAMTLDPTYTAKSMSALLAEIRKGNLDPQTFAFPNQISPS